MKSLLTRREFINATAIGLGSCGLGGCGETFDWQAFFQKRFQEMSPEEVEKVLQRLENNYAEKYGAPFSVKATPAAENVTFGFGIDLSKCGGCKACIAACRKENNISSNMASQYIQVVRMEEGTFNLETAGHYSHPQKAGDKEYYNLPIQCQQCENAPCVKVCPVKAIWREPDGIIVIDYNWCTGCRDCMAACPYRAIQFNWAKPVIPDRELNPQTHYLGNRPRMRGVVEKCHFCVQRTRERRLPACVEACSTGARKFGNLLDAESDIRFALSHFKTFKLKEELNTQPKFYYFFSESRGQDEQQRRQSRRSPVFSERPV